MKKNSPCSLIIFINLIFALFCCSDNRFLKYQLTVYDSSENKAVVHCEFTCEDSNDDGIIEIDELIDFNESGPHLFWDLDKEHTEGWRSEVDMKNMPEIINGLKNIDVFHFDINEYNRGKYIINYETGTGHDLAVGKYFFTRIVKIGNNEEHIRVISWIGDEERGLEMVELNSENLTLKIERR
ncbi:MAG: hypothetical protein JW822_09150 [Spirochaetales bacterium]|nr:hypothetical protein [Spirochaetales bacterium]